jgi:hypothetical protein
MDNRKFEKLIDLIINENEEQARDLFHEIVVDKSREIYESIMEEEMMDEGMYEDEMEEGMGGQVGDLLDEIESEEHGMMEEEDMDDEVEMSDDDETFDLDVEDVEDADEGDSEEVEDAVIRIEDKLDQLMAEFESIMGGDASMGDEEVEVDAEEDSEEVMEAVQLQKVSVTHGDNGAQTKSPVAANAGQAGMASKPVKASTTTENGRTAPTAKDVDGASKFKNAPGQKKQELSAAPKPVTKDGSSNDRSPVAK